MTHRRIDLRIPVAAGGQLPEGLSLAVTVHVPASPQAGAPVLFAFPGGGYGRGYFDLRPEGFTGYSQAEHHVARGMVVVAVDHLAVGDSSLPQDEELIAPVGESANPRFRSAGPVTLAVIAAAGDAAVRAAIAGLRDGTLDPSIPAIAVGATIGAGQSMGGHIVAVMQANHDTFDGVALLGSSFTQTRLTLHPGRRYPLRNAPLEAVFQASQADSDWINAFHWPAEPPELIAADMNPASGAPWRSRAIPAAGRQLMEPGILAREAAQVRCPVLLAYGEVDVTADPLVDAGRFVSTCDLSLLIVPRMAHMHNFAPTRARLWRRLDEFAFRLAQEAAQP